MRESAGDDLRFADRRAAGQALGVALISHLTGPDPLVLGLARGGMPVAREVARALRAELDVLVVRKLGVPGHEELAMGAVASGGLVVLNRVVLGTVGLDDAVVAGVTTRERAVLARRERAYRGGRPMTPVVGREVVLVDDGLATGSTMRAALGALRAAGPARVVTGVPVAPRETCLALEQEADAVVCLHTPEPFHAVSCWYDDFRAVTDDEVRELLRASRGECPPDD